MDFTEDPAASLAYLNDQRNRRKVKEASEKLKINIIAPLREGKKLLVLDIDYSGCGRLGSLTLLITSTAILDTRPLTSGLLPPDLCARPGLHEFLETIYPYYDSEQILNSQSSQFKTHYP